MTRGNVDYSKGCIYKICCKDSSITDIYIGSTTNFRGRKSQHKSSCNNENANGFNMNIYKTIREKGGWENWDMVLIENYSSNSKKELEKREREKFDELKPTLNTVRPIVTLEEMKETHIKAAKNYLINNPERRKETHKTYYNNHKEILRDKGNKRYENIGSEKIQCECGKIYTKHHKLRHEKTNKHIKYINTISS
jgi:hypothetical protein